MLIGPPASGKTTLARCLTPLITAPEDAPAQLLSTDAIRAEVFGDAAVQGPWLEIQQRLHLRIQEAVASGIPVVVDATHARRPWRLALTEALKLPAPVEWIGWWLHTPLPTCMEWNRHRQRQVPEPVIQEMAAALADPHSRPSRAEGFAAICTVVPTHHEALEPVLVAELAALDRRIRRARARETHWQLHGYSRLLDLERLLFLIRLLCTWPELDDSDPVSREQLTAIVSPLPSGDLAERAAAYLSRLHGDCFGDAGAIRTDLAWLEANGFCFGGEMSTPIRLADQPGAFVSMAPSLNRHDSAVTFHGGVNGGFPPMGDGPVFQRVMTLLRHIVHYPYQRDPASSLSLHEQLIAATAAIPGGYLPGEAATLRKDLEKLLTPYGFRAAHDNVRHGYAIGTAVLSAPRLREIETLVQQAASRLADLSAQPLLEDLQRRLSWANFAESSTPVRLFARHGVVDTTLVRRDSLATPRGIDAIEKAISQRQLVLLRRYPCAGSQGETSPGDTTGGGSGSWRVWPLQLIFHHVGWYLLAEEDSIGQEHGLIRCERLDRLAIHAPSARSGSLDGLRRSAERHHKAVQRLERLLHYSGGIYFGESLIDQLTLASPVPRIRTAVLQTLRFSATPWAFAFLREGMGRYPREHVRFSKPLPADNWWYHSEAPHVLEPNAASDTHPYPLELDLPRWTLAADIDLRTWLYGFGEGIRIDSPTSLREELIARCGAMLRVHGVGVENSGTGRDVKDDASVPASFPNRSRQE
ncbi:MAG: AAA family ATPase [Synechococcaceae cyanobacterium]|nr:AAA family ATPase [Synechococcaceae cyanobacterium]